MSGSMTRLGRVTVDDLVAAGFTDEQIERLSKMKEAYPYIEFVETIDEWRRLAFLKWRYVNGLVTR